MAKTKLKDRLQSQLFLLDGGMGSQLMARQVVVNRGTDYLNVENPSAVQAIHADYVKAGADAILTNTLGANPITLDRHDLADQCTAINEAGARIARQAAGPDRYVLGDIGSCGEFLEPLGTLKPEDLKAAFMVQAKSLKAGGVDGFIIETMTALDETVVAIEAVKAFKLPILVSLAFDATANGFRTMMGVDVETMVSTLVPLGVDAIGFNCGTATLDQYVDLADAFVRAVKACSRPVPIYAEPNAGKPNLEDGRAVWAVTPDAFAKALQRIYAKGIHILGGCCGTGPEHIRAVASLLKKPVRHQ
jgi:5-methyltetrahydrofolate--homocysteine methyltransferase